MFFKSEPCLRTSFLLFKKIQNHQKIRKINRKISKINCYLLLKYVNKCEKVQRFLKIVKNLLALKYFLCHTSFAKQKLNVLFLIYHSYLFLGNGDFNELRAEQFKGKVYFYLFI